MQTKSTFLFFGLVILILVTQCKTNSSSDQAKNDTTPIQPSKNLAATKFDTVNEQLNSKSELMTQDLVELKIIDTSVTTQLSETCYCDTTVQLNDSIYYSVIIANDEAGVCTYFFVAGLNTKKRTVTASKFLYPDCDIDYSWDTYELYEHAIVSKEKIQVTKTTVFQKKNRTSPGEERNIDHKQTQKTYISITQSGKISNSK